ncbi:PREDICTED: receptor protein kinase-like protein ZAR1 isoform X2 [Tarenaya hassleriana]|uniref:receptor protein kinase-like protein ZAR1 isoform X1 n=1 Tax=Tarenaya hassleriana TaxID=28532 RepID=UPI00053C7C2A|nr:PREDICTED: receptor protein kinase-like protein ZAR1 isoform X1 [Tarenaya hassleriana]XP_010524283.1 PREDICTED: receptor protein kinase-like protein ZAR1 isoform X2 [Tarenaya hassleriana]
MHMLRFCFLSVSLIFLCMSSFCSSLNSDGLSLLALKSAVETDPSRVMSSWSDSDLTPCHWAGIVCTRGRVTSLVLAGKSLSGYIPSELGLLDSLLRLDLSHNNFSKLVPTHLFDATNLRHIDLSHNSLSGQIPPEIRAVKNLTHLDFSSNHLNGTLPESLTELGSLVGTLNLSYNRFSGEIPPSYGQFPVFVSLDIGHNNLSGKVPQVGSLLNQGPTALAGNPNLCGFPLQTPCEPAENHRIVISNPETSRNPQKPNPSFVDQNRGKDRQITGSVTVSLISGFSVVVGAVSISVWLIRRRRSSDKVKTENDRTEMTKRAAEFDEEGQNGKFVVMDEGFELELEDLLRASAYVMGKSRSGIVYKVVAGRGSGATATTVAAVRRLSDGDATWRGKEFEAEVEAIGKVHHPNIVRLRAYYYAADEKLLITDFLRNGSLYSALHGVPSNTSPPLSWGERLRIALGTARGLTYIHEFSPRKYVHGNLKSTKILLDDELQPHISGFGLTRLVSGYSTFTGSLPMRRRSLSQDLSTYSTMASRISAPSAAYLAPEARASSGCKLTQKCDVFSFGVILLELLTGRLPNSSSENDGEELVTLVRRLDKEERPWPEIIDPELLNADTDRNQMVAAIHVALNCTEMDPEVRPRMRTVSENLGRIKPE